MIAEIHIFCKHIEETTGPVWLEVLEELMVTQLTRISDILKKNSEY